MNDEPLARVSLRSGTADPDERGDAPMSGSDLDVDLDELRDMAGTLVRLAAALSTCHPRRDDEFGSTALAEASAAFRSRWGRGVDDLRDDLTHAAHRLRQTADAYALADEEAAAQLCLQST